MKEYYKKMLDKANTKIDHLNQEQEVAAIFIADLLVENDQLQKEIALINQEKTNLQNTLQKMTLENCNNLYLGDGIAIQVNDGVVSDGQKENGV